MTNAKNITDAPTVEAAIEVALPPGQITTKSAPRYARMVQRDPKGAKHLIAELAPVGHLIDDGQPEPDAAEKIPPAEARRLFGRASVPDAGDQLRRRSHRTDRHRRSVRGIR